MAEQNATKFEFKAEMKQLLHLIIHSLYTHPEVFLRELVSNSSDALNKIRFKKLTDKDIVDFDSELRIDIKLDKENKRFTIEDSGIGMSKEDLLNKLGTIASSGTLEFLKQMQKSGEKLDGNMIGQFGVGFYSLFMVTDQVEVETKSFDKNEPAWKWISSGEDSFEIEESTKETRGTKITFKLKDDYAEFAEDWKVKSTLKKYSNFVDFPLFVDGEKVNTVDAIWFRKKDDIKEEEYKEFYKFVSGNFDEPLEWLHLNIEGTINFKAIVFIPESAPNNLFTQDIKKTLQLYVNRVFIQDDSQGLLPDYLSFVRGVIDCEDLPLNVSREVTQNSPIMAKINKILTGKILTWLEEIASERKEKYTKFYKEFGSLFKVGANQDFANKDKVLELLRFETTKFEEYTSLADYSERMNEEQNDILYFSGDSRDKLLKDPSLEYFLKNDIEVLLLTDPGDVFTVPYIGKYKEKELKSIDKAEIKSEAKDNEESISSEAKESLVKLFKEVLDDKVEDVKESNRLVDSPVTLVAGEQGMDMQMEKMMMAMDKNFTGSKKVLEINPNHQIIKNIHKQYIATGNSLEIRETVNQLFDSALLLQGNLQSPADFVKRLYGFMEKATA